MRKHTTGTLFVVGTPIGNLEDITYRAVKILNEVDAIAAEDTRHSNILLKRYNISKKMTSYNEHNREGKGRYLIGLLEEGKDIALVCNAGMPGISDPGYDLIKKAIDKDINVIPIPGPSAIVTALSISGLSTRRFVYEGFIPNKSKERNKLLKKLICEERTIVVFESPYRIKRTLDAIFNILGDRYIIIVRELTKKFEEILRGKVSELIGLLQKREIKGEITLIIEGVKPSPHHKQPSEEHRIL